MSRRHVCGLDCLKVESGRLYHACRACRHGSKIPIARSRFFGGSSVRRHKARRARSQTLGYSAYEPLTTRERACAALIVPRMIQEQKKGRWKSRRQAIAVALSKARKEC